ncbi:DUF6397 family protein [Streptomyces sp. NPDC097619]|uniref:DUF6397 family protein n=1 Tax=Streptomyces sp. NPDC097619 TaxID=3157228 RepID=UPI00332F6C0D
MTAYPFRPVHPLVRAAWSAPAAPAPAPITGAAYGSVPAAIAERTCTGSRAAAELALRRGEFETAVQLGLVRTAARGPDGVRHYARAELDRIRARPGFPETLRGRVRTVGAAPGAALLGISPGRFARLARCGYLTPVAYRVNRYRAVVWCYLEREVRALAERHPVLLSGRASERDRDRIAAGTDLRARNWRGRHAGMLLGQRTDPWERAAVPAWLLGPAALAAAVPDPAVRRLLEALAPAPPFGHPRTGEAARTADPLLRAAEPDEIAWYRAGLGLALAEARTAPTAPLRSVEGDRGQRAHVHPGPVLPHEPAVLVE